jgi:hypothetical protein
MKSVLAIESSGNQAFVYRSNRLREAIGASEILSRVGTTWLDESLREFPNVEVVVGTSAKAILLGDQSDLRGLLRKLTTKALVEAPGLDLVGGIAEIVDENFFAAVRQAFQNLAQNRSFLNGPETRFPRLPIVASCSSTGQPAQGVGKRNTLVSSEVAQKIQHAESGIARQKVSGVKQTIFRNLDELEKFGADSSWVSVVHADGNGLGQLFLNFDQHLISIGQSEITRQVATAADSYRTFSQTVEKCTREAYESAVRFVSDIDGRNGLVPVLIGGDDITAIVTGDIALAFAEKYCREFAEICATNQNLKSLGVTSLTASASVVWTKPHYPYWSSYDHASELLDAAKNIGRRVQNGQQSAPSLLDVHVVYDSSSSGISDDARGGQKLRGGPYTFDVRQDQSNLWSLSDLLECVGLVQDLSGSAIHSVRDQLTIYGSDAARTRIDEISQGSSDENKWNRLKGFIPNRSESKPVLLITAMELERIVDRSSSFVRGVV